MFRTFIHHQELATILLNYRIGHIVLGSMCVGVSVWLGWSGIRVAGFNKNENFKCSPPTLHTFLSDYHPRGFKKCWNFM